MDTRIIDRKIFTAYPESELLVVSSGSYIGTWKKNRIEVALPYGVFHLKTDKYWDFSDRVKVRVKDNTYTFHLL